MEYLIERKHQKIYIVTGPPGSFDSMQRMKAIKQAQDRVDNIEWVEIEGDFKKRR